MLPLLPGQRARQLDLCHRVEIPPLIRFADDFVIGCAEEADARKIMAVLPKRFARFGLRIHPTKTALRAFRKPEAGKDAEDGNGTFDFLSCFTNSGSYFMLQVLCLSTLGIFPIVSRSHTFESKGRKMLCVDLQVIG